MKEKRFSDRGPRALNRSAVLLVALILGALLLSGCSVVKMTPDVTNLEFDSSTILLDRNGMEIYRLHAGENRTPVALKQVPKHVRNAFLAIEDPNFEDHRGLHFRGIARAAWRSALYLVGLPGGRLEGGSTITQQLARSALLNQEVSLQRKLQEAWVAIQLERHYTKEEILELYLNQIYFGRGAYGIQAAARTFFGKEAADLTLAEGAQLAGMINGPSYYDPFEHPEDSVARRNLVLSAMLREGLIDQKSYQAAKGEEPHLVTSDGHKTDEPKVRAGHFTDYVISVLQDSKPGLAARYGLKLGDAESVAKAGLKVHTTLDPRLQRLAEEAVTEQMAIADKQYGLVGRNPRPEAALIAMNPKTGEILAMVGGREHKAMLEFNRATDAMRQPGSAIKPFVAYLPALEAGLTPATIFDDAPIMLSNNGKTVWPQNYDFRYLGLKSMRYGVEQSVNPMAVRAMQAAGGPGKAADYARKFGLTSISQEDEHLALALGGVSEGVSVLDMTTAYSALANLGTRIDPVIISKVVDRDGKVVYEAHPKRRQVVRPGAAYLMVDMMKDVIRKGTAYGFTRGFNGWPAAAKTGTTEDNRDGWFIGFTPDLVVTVWNGYDNPDHHLKWTAAFVPVKTWNHFMTRAVSKRSPDWPRPADVVPATVCRLTGMLPDANCPPGQVGTEWFLKGTEPTMASNMLVKAEAVEVTVQTPDKKQTYKEWQLWQPGCVGRPVEKLFIRRPQPRVQHPTEPYNPKYVPADAKDELPTKQCQPVSFWDRLFPNVPGMPAPTPPGTGTEAPPANGKPPRPPAGGSSATPPGEEN